MAINSMHEQGRLRKTLRLHTVAAVRRPAGARFYQGFETVVGRERGGGSLYAGRYEVCEQLPRLLNEVHWHWRLETTALF